MESVGVSGLGGGFVNKESELWEEEGPKCFMACVVFALIWNIWFQYFKNAPSQANFCEICWLLYSILLQDLLKEYIWLIISRLELLLVCFFFFFSNSLFLTVEDTFTPILICISFWIFLFIIFPSFSKKKWFKLRIIVKA